MQLSGNTILITGGSSGIGYAMMEAFLARGNTVAICGRSEQRLGEAKRKHPSLHCYPCDVACEQNWEHLVERVRADLPGLNVFVNNAGIQRDIDFTNGLEEFLAGENEIRVNLEAPIVLSGLFIPLLAKNPHPAIINVSSGLGFVPAARMPVYSASKAGMHAWSMAIRLQLAKVGIKVFEIVPPAVDTNLNPEGRARRGNFRAGLEPEQFVSAVMIALGQDVFEIGYGMTAEFIHASRAELDRRFQHMNSRM